jgi:hydrogenase maturation protease
MTTGTTPHDPGCRSREAFRVACHRRTGPSALPGAIAARWHGSDGFGPDDAIALAVALDQMPGRLIVHAIEAADLTQGTGLTPLVAAAVATVAAAILDDIGPL